MRSNAAPCPPGSRTLVPIGSATATRAIRPVRMSSSPNVRPGSLALPDPSRPGPGEAVGLLLGVDRRHVAIEVAGAELHGVAELVGQHDGDDRRAEPLGELVDDPELAVVVRHEVAVGAVERPVVADLLVARVAREAAAGDRRGAFRVGGEDPAGQRYAMARRRAVGTPGPPCLDVGERGGEVGVVEPRRLGVTGIDDIADRLDRRRPAWSTSSPGPQLWSELAARWWSGRRPPASSGWSCRGRSRRSAGSPPPARRWRTARARSRRWWQPAPVGESSPQVYGRLSPLNRRRAALPARRSRPAGCVPRNQRSGGRRRCRRGLLPRWPCRCRPGGGPTSARRTARRRRRPRHWRVRRAAAAVAIPGISDGSTAWPIQAIAWPSSATAGASISASSCSIKPISTLCSKMIERATVCSRGSVSGRSRNEKLISTAWSVVFAHVLQEADVDVGRRHVVRRIGDQPADHAGDQGAGDDHDDDVDGRCHHGSTIVVAGVVVGVDDHRFGGVDRLIGHPGSLPTGSGRLLRCASGIAPTTMIRRCRSRHRGGEPVTLVDVQEVTVRFGGIVALDSLTFGIEAGTHLRADRSQRGRQDDDVQRRQPDLRTDVRTGDVRRPGPAGRAGPRDRLPRHRQDVPESRPVPLDEPARERDGRGPQPGQRRASPRRSAASVWPPRTGAPATSPATCSPSSASAR